MAGKPSDNLPEKAKPTLAFEFQGVEVTRDEAGHISLTDMWKAQGSPANQDPPQWARYAGASFVASLAKSLNVGKSHVIKSKRGKGVAGTWAHWQVALAYAKYLSPEFHRYVNEAFVQQRLEEVNPEIKLDRAANALLERGHTVEWIGRRLKGIGTRKQLMGTMADHCCKVRGKDNPFAEITRAMSLEIFGKTPREIRDEKGLKPSEATRDSFDDTDLLLTELAESQAKKLIQKHAANGNEQCVSLGLKAAKVARQAREAFEKI